jgi:hypothetical protein
VKYLVAISLVAFLPSAPAQNPPVKPIDPSKTIPVVARGVGPVPGALLCPDMDTVRALFDQYAASVEDRMQDRVTGGESALIRGSATPAPKPAGWGCVLVKAGTRMLLEKGHIVPVVRVSLPNGDKVRGVTQENMFSRLAVTPPSPGQY